jgi:N-formylglutamate deformylase
MNIILTIPHSSENIPENLLQNYKLKPEEMLQHIDFGVDKIYAPFNINKIEAKVSRFVVDVNRKRDDINSDQGVLIRKDWHGNEVWKNFPKDAESLLKKYYDPFYAEIDKIPQNSFVWDCHSMDSQGNQGGGDKGNERPDICIATGDFTLCPEEVALKLKELFAFEGYDVRIDDPYKGLRANIMQKVKENGSIGVEFEVAKRIYMDEKTLVLDDVKIEKLRRVLCDAFDYITSLKFEDLENS